MCWCCCLDADNKNIVQLRRSANKSNYDFFVHTIHTACSNVFSVIVLFHFSSIHFFRCCRWRRRRVPSWFSSSVACLIWFGDSLLSVTNESNSGKSRKKRRRNNNCMSYINNYCFSSAMMYMQYEKGQNAYLCEIIYSREPETFSQ